MTATLTVNMIARIVIPSTSLFLTTIAYASPPQEFSGSEVEYFTRTAADLVFEQDTSIVVEANEVTSVNNENHLLSETNKYEQPTTNRKTFIAEKSSIPDDGEEGKAWTFKVQPYYTIPWKVYGQATVEGITVDLDIGLGELVDLLQAYANIRFEAWHGNWGIIADASYWSFRGINNFDKLLMLIAVFNWIEHRILSLYKVQ